MRVRVCPGLGWGFPGQFVLLLLLLLLLRRRRVRVVPGVVPEVVPAGGAVRGVDPGLSPVILGRARRDSRTIFRCAPRGESEIGMGNRYEINVKPM